MPSTTTVLLSLAAAALTHASPIARRQEVAFEVTDFSYGCSPGGCTWGMNVANNWTSVNHPSFGPTFCNGTSSTQGFNHECAPFSPAAENGYRSLDATVANGTLTIYYAVTDSQGATYHFDGNKSVQVTTYGGQEPDFDVLENHVYAVAKRSEPAKRSDVYPASQCDDYYNSCISNSPSEEKICSNAQTQCLACASQETSCRDGADYSAQLSCTTQAQKCYFKAENYGTLNGSYGPDQAFRTCKAAPMENNAYCASENSAIKSCQDKEDQCRTGPEANQASCSAQTAMCYDQATDL